MPPRRCGSSRAPTAPPGWSTAVWPNRSPCRVCLTGVAGRHLFQVVLKDCKVYVEARAEGRSACRIVDTTEGSIFPPPGGCFEVSEPTRGFRLTLGTWIALWEENSQRFHLATYSPTRGYRRWFSYRYADGEPIDAWPFPGAIRMNTDCDLRIADCRAKFSRLRTWEFTGSEGLRLLHPDMVRVLPRKR